MALEWGKEISFSGLKKRSPRQKQVYPEKRYINLAMADKKTVDLRRTVPVAIIVVVLVGLFVKFGVLDFYGKVAEKQNELSAQTAQLASLQAQLTNYDAVLEEYQGYESMSLDATGLTVETEDAIALVDNVIEPRARVATLALSGNTLTLSLTDITLDGVGQLVSKLYEQDIVENVSVSTAATQQTASEDVTVAVTITLSPVAVD